MPELPDIEAYIESLKKRIFGRPLNSVRLKRPFVLRTSLPPLSEIKGKKVTSIHRVEKQIVFHPDIEKGLSENRSGTRRTLRPARQEKCEEKQR